MKKIRRILSAILICAVVVTLSACGRMTPEKLLLKMTKEGAEAPSTQASAALHMDFGMGVAGMTMEMEIDLDSRIMEDPDEDRFYMDMNVGITAFGQTVKKKMEIFTEEEDDRITAYTHMREPDVWIKSVKQAEDTDEDLDEDSDLDEILSFLKWLKDKPLGELTLAEGTRKIDGTEVYTLTTTLTGTQLQQVMRMFGGEEAGLGQLDLSGITIPVTLDTDAETFRPVRLEIELQGLKDIFMKAIQDEMGDMIAGIKMEVTKWDASLVISDFGFDPAAVPRVPQEGLDNAIDADQAGAGLGSVF